jgi:DNA-binding winged helix-turn-helix (wHTH) protein/tetratricopeptide (TPR) repeat protein
MRLENKDVVHFEDYVIDRPGWSLQWRQEPIALNRKSFDLLLYLVDHRDRVVGKDELLQALWPDQFVEESNLTQHIFLLRKALARHESGRKIIETVPGRGYRFAAPIEMKTIPAERSAAVGPILLTASESISEVTIEEEIDPSSDGSPAPPPQIRRTRRWIPVLAIVLGAIALCVGGWFGWQRWLDQSSGSPVEVVLMPMEGTTGDAILDRALVDALRIDLAQSPFVNVVPSSRIRSTLTQMRHKPDDPMSQAMAREVCERLNSQAVLHGAIARVGRHFLITEEGTSCVSGAILAEAKREADSSEDLPHAMEGLAAGLRQKLGESRRSVARFDKSLFHENTASLEALKDYSLAVHDYEQGKLTEAITMDQRAIAADPSFAGAYFALASYNITAGDDGLGRAAMVKAYNLRESASEPTRLAIEVVFNLFNREDLFGAETICRNWTELYPRSPNAWNLLSNTELDLGKIPESTAHAEIALNIWPESQGNVYNLAADQMRNGEPNAGRATLDHAIANHMDGDFIRANYLVIAYALHDPALIQVQRQWAVQHPDSPWFLMNDGLIATSEGRLADSRKLIAQAADALRRQGNPAMADSFLRSQGANLVEAGDLDRGKQLLHSSPIDPEEAQEIIGLVNIGELAPAAADLRAMRAKYPDGTLWNLYWGPRIQAGIALAGHKPSEAIALMESTRQFDRRGYLGVIKFRGDAYLAAGQFREAEKEYRDILAHPDLEPTSVDLPLSWVGLGRALAAEGNRPGAIDAYQHFFSLWIHADPDAPMLKHARQEFAALH